MNHCNNMRIEQECGFGIVSKKCHKEKEPSNCRKTGDIIFKTIFVHLPQKVFDLKFKPVREIKYESHTVNMELGRTVGEPFIPPNFRSVHICFQLAIGCQTGCWNFWKIGIWPVPPANFSHYFHSHTLKNTQDLVLTIFSNLVKGLELRPSTNF